MVKVSPTFGDDDPPSSKEDEQPRGTKNLSIQSFQIEAQVDICMYDGTVDIEKLDNWLD